MRRSGSWSFIVIASLAALGCQDLSTGGGEFGLQFDGSGSCGTADLPNNSFPPQLTVEAWVQGADSPAYSIHPLVVWPGAFALYETADGIASFTDASTDEAGATYPGSWMDGELHHIAATWDEDTTTTTLYFDGERVGINASAVLGQQPTGTMQIGCWQDKNLAHEGIIDEARVSDNVRYDGDFSVPSAPFDGDDSTLQLWHMNEGEGDYALDDQQRADIFLQGVDWTEFSPFSTP